MSNSKGKERGVGGTQPSTPSAPGGGLDHNKGPPQQQGHTSPIGAQSSGARVQVQEQQEEEEKLYKCCGCRFPLFAAILQLLFGVSIAVVAFVMLGVAPLATRDTPHWAGIPVCIVALIGLVVLCVNYKAEEDTSLQFCTKITYFLLCVLGMALSLLAVSFCGHHYTQLTGYSCQLNARNGTCECRVDPRDPIARVVRYAGVSDCSDVTGSLKAFLLLQVALNLLLAIVCLLTCYIMWKHRYEVFYSGLRLFAVTSVGAAEASKQKV
ncbi:unnamed protein product [Lampetra planeri]